MFDHAIKKEELEAYQAMQQATNVETANAMSRYQIALNALFANQLDQRFEKIDSRFDQIDRRFDQVDRRMDNFENELRWLKGIMAGTFILIVSLHF